MPRKPAGRTPPDPLEEVEETQEQLRESIEESKRLAAKTQQLIQKHKKDLND